MSEELKIIIAAETKKLRSELEKAQKEVQKLSKTGKEKFNQFNEEFQKVGGVAKKACAAMATAITGAVTAILALGASTAEYRTAQAKLNTAFETAGGSAAAATQTYNDLYRVLGDGDVAVEAAGHLAKLTTNEKELSEWTTICQGVYATFGDSLPIEGLTEAANETAKVGTVTGSLADALNWAGISEDAFNESLAACNTEAEREKLIRETLNGLYDDAAANYETNAAAVLAQNEANAKLEASMAKVGEAVAPINTALTELGAEVLAQLEPYITQFAQDYLPQIVEALSGVGDTVGKVVTFIADNWELISTIAIVITGICVALSVFSTVMGIVNAVMMASPVTWIVLAIVAAIAALVAIIVVVIKYWDEIKAATQKCWEAIKNAVQTAIDWVVGFFNKLIEFVKSNWQGLLLLIVNPFAGAFKLAYDNCDGFRAKVDAFVAKIKDMIAQGFNFVKEKIINPIREAFNTVSEVFGNIVNAIKTKLETAKNTVKSIIDAIKGFFKFEWSLPKLKMPSISITGKFSLNPIQVPKFSISWNEFGGVFDSPTLFNYGGSLQGIGENGAEAVVPLENNLGWLDRLCDMMTERLRITAPIVMNVDGVTFAQVACNSINQLTRQRGSIPLNLV